MTDGTDEHQEAAVNGQRTAEGPRPRRGFWFGLVVAHRQAVHADSGPSRTSAAGRTCRGPAAWCSRPNHISHFDPLVLGFYIWECRRIPRLLGKASVFKLPIVGRILSSAGQIPVYRESTEAADAFRAAVAAVEQGECVGVYAEGTITRDPDLWPMTGKTGAARIALMTGCPVIPIANWGAQEVIRAVRQSEFRLLPRKTMRVTGRRTGRPERVPGQADHRPSCCTRQPR